MLRTRKYTILIIILLVLVSINVLINIDKGYLADRQTYYFSQYFNQKNSKVINPHHYAYILNPPTEVCPSSKKLNLLALVTSASDNFESREVIRKTWANAELFPSMEAVFIIGKSANETVNDLLVSESKTYGDIAQEDFMDTYLNLTTKTVMAMKWAAMFCNSTKFFLKVDDDMIVNSYALLPFLEVYPQPLVNTVLCLPNLHNKVDRNLTSKFYKSEKDYSSEYYPPYCNGGAYMMSSDMPLKLYTTSLLTYLFVFEDVYLGMLIEKLGAAILSLKQNYCWSTSHCYYGLNRRIKEVYFFFLNGTTPKRMLAGWQEITEKMMEVFSGKIQPEPKFL